MIVDRGSSHRFGQFRLDTQSRILTRNGAIVTLAPKTLDLLIVFVTSSGRLLTKDHLLRTVWDDVNVEEASLAFQVSTLRKALGEYGPAWIETVPKHGYRFTAPVEPEALIERAPPHHTGRDGPPTPAAALAGLREGRAAAGRGRRRGEHVVARPSVHHVEIDRHVCGAVSGRCEAADDDEFDTGAGQDPQQVREIGHVARAFGRERRTASAKRCAEFIFTTRSPVVSFRFSRRSV